MLLLPIGLRGGRTSAPALSLKDASLSTVVDATFRDRMLRGKVGSYTLLLLMWSQLLLSSVPFSWRLWESLVLPWALLLSPTCLAGRHPACSRGSVGVRWLLVSPAAWFFLLTFVVTGVPVCRASPTCEISSPGVGVLLGRPAHGSGHVYFSGEHCP